LEKRAGVLALETTKRKADYTEWSTKRVKRTNFKTKKGLRKACRSQRRPRALPGGRITTRCRGRRHGLGLLEKKGKVPGGHQCWESRGPMAKEVPVR